MLEPSAIDLASLCEALEDHSDFVQWFFDPQTGETVLWSDDMDDVPEPEVPPLIFVEPVPSHEGYNDMQDFVETVRDPRIRDRLARSLEGRGAFRRFKDTLFEFPETRQAWFRFHDSRMRRRAIEWLRDEGVVGEAEADRAASQLAAEDEPARAVDAFDVARQIARDLKPLFGTRLVDVVVFGSYATDTAIEDSDLDLLVVLNGVASPWDEARRMDDVLWTHTLESGITVSAAVIDARDWEVPRWPTSINAKQHGRSVA